MNYLITGITGFAGPNLANLLSEKGHKVYGLVRGSNGRENDIRDIVPDANYEKIEFIYRDFTRKKDMDGIFKDFELDGVFHLGAQSHPPTSFEDPEGTWDTNVNGTRNIIEAIKKYQPTCAMMFCSTSEVYGAVEESYGPIKEDAVIKPMNPYGMSKAVSDVEVLGQANIKASPFNLPFFVTRAFSHTGIRRGNRFSISSDAYQLIRIKKGLQEPKISVGTLSSKRVVVDVKDCVNAYYMLMERAVKGDEKVIGEPFNVGGEGLHEMRYFLDEMLDIAGLKGEVEEWVNPKFVRKIDIPVQIPDSTKLRELTGWKPEIPIRQTLEDLLNYWDKKITV